METPTVQNTLSKSERLHGKNSISVLLAKGRHGKVPGFRYCYYTETQEDHPRMMVSVSKRFFKRAVKRNLLKRRIREAYRRLKNGLPAGTDVLFMYNTKEVLDYQTIYSSIENIIKNISENGQGKA